MRKRSHPRNGVLGIARSAARHPLRYSHTHRSIARPPHYDLSIMTMQQKHTSCHESGSVSCTSRQDVSTGQGLAVHAEGRKLVGPRAEVLTQIDLSCMRATLGNNWGRTSDTVNLWTQGSSNYQVLGAVHVCRASALCPNRGSQGCRRS